MLLHGRLVHAFHDHTAFGEGLGEALGHVALADAVVIADVVLAVRVQLGRAGLHRLFGVEHRRQVLPLDLHQLARGARLRLGLRDNQRDLIADKAHHVRAGLVSARTTEHRLVLDLQAVLVDRHIFRGEDRDDAGRGFGRDRVDVNDAGVHAEAGLGRKQRCHVERVGVADVARIQRLAGDLARRVDAFGAGADSIRACGATRAYARGFMSVVAVHALPPGSGVPAGDVAAFSTACRIL